MIDCGVTIDKSDAIKQIYDQVNQAGDIFVMLRDFDFSVIISWSYDSR